VKVVILAGGYGTRLSEETTVRPKPMVEIGTHPLLWHIMKIYGAQGLSDFVICCGYKGYMIKEYFSNYALHSSNVTFDLKRGTVELQHRDVEPWTVTLVDTGIDTQTGGRLKRVAEYLDDDDFAMTYGDAVSTVDLSKLTAFHRSQGTLATITAVSPPSRFGALEIEGPRVTRFREKPDGGDARINGGFFVLSPRVLDYIDGDDTLWEHEPLERLASEGQLGAFLHDGFWQPMDTLRDRKVLEDLWDTGDAPWKIW
jgi:glucose-1-phosphate cytidylyltransferase